MAHRIEQNTEHQKAMNRKIAAINAVLFGFIWLVILYAGADHPPPPGFLLIVLLVIGCTVVVYRRVPTYIDWIINRKEHRYIYVFLDGIAAGFCAGLLVVFASILGTKLGWGTAYPAALADFLIWSAVLSFLGAVNSVLIFSINGLILRRSKYFKRQDY